ncbi:cardiolipin synthase B [Dissulfurispira thermophila]|uniref:Cardiolipin synthase B n=1 Tax=Dissulfurispira thermophila TaxID=2715679 RepID=A0A7G1H5E6_9BACT|nr:phospholipase D-like domain-containing protein [Dissulfurispira thermophila]BCB96947.1 cardiolipin synthase B [Dissulfurispira thermophila]
MTNTFMIHAIERIFEGKFSLASNIQLLWKGNESFQTIFDTIRTAEKLICLEFYIFRNDETGTELAKLLKQKSIEGIKVYLLYDHFGSFGTSRKFWKDMEDAGIKIRASRPFKWTSPFNYVRRDHRKLIIVDNKKAFTGGLNIANEYSGFHLRSKGKVWRDTGIMLEGPIVNELFDAFRKWWYIWGGDPIEVSDLKIQNSNLKDGIPAIPIFVSSAKGRRRMRRLLYYSINHAQKSISLTTAYFTPSKRMVETLENAVNRGVKVRLIVPGISDVPAASYAGRAFFTRLLKAGIEIYYYIGEILHAKTYIFDNCWSIIGSTNLDFQSLRYNDEGNVGILDTDFTMKMNMIFEDDLKNSVKINLDEWNKRPLKEKLKEYFFSFFRRRL